MTRIRRGLKKSKEPYIGRRTRKPIIINARIDENGFERISDYFPDTDSDVSISQPSQPDEPAAQENDDKENGAVEVNESINNSKLNVSKRKSSSRTLRKLQNTNKNGKSSKGKIDSAAKLAVEPNTSNRSPEINVGATGCDIPSPTGPDSLPVFVPDKLLPSNKKPVSSVEKQVSSPAKLVSSQGKEAQSNAPASVNSSKSMSSSPVDDMNPGSTRKKLHFSGFCCEEEHLDIEQSLITTSEVDDLAEDEYIISDSSKEANAANKRSAAKKSVKNNKRKTSTQEYIQNKDDSLTRQSCKSNETFLTLKKKSNGTLPKTTTSKSIKKRQGKVKPRSGKRASKKTSRQSSENSSVFLSHDRATVSPTFPASGGSVENDSSDWETSSGVSESEEDESTIQAPRSKKKRARKVESLTTSKIEADDVEQGLRRSTRTRVPALQYWKNERIEYERRSLGYVVKDIIRFPTPAPMTRKRRLQKEQTKSKSKKAMHDSADSKDEDSDLSDCQIPDDMAKVTNPESVVIDEETMKEIPMTIIHSGQNLDLRAPSREDGSVEQDATLLVDKYFSEKNFGVGQILLRPGAEKGRQHVRQDTMVFYIISGNVLVSVHNQNFILKKGSTFFVPPGNIYNLKNVHRRKNAHLFFTQVKRLV